jgi:hypothetical protein
VHSPEEILAERDWEWGMVVAGAAAEMDGRIVVVGLDDDHLGPRVVGLVRDVPA